VELGFPKLQRRWLTSIGGFIATLGLLSTFAHMTGIDARVLGWIDARGRATGWLIRAVLLVVGGTLYAIGKWQPVRILPGGEKQPAEAAVSPP